MPRYTPKDIGQIVRTARRNMGVTQRDVALTCGCGLRFVGELEQGKATCQLGKVLTVLNTLGVVSNLVPPPPREHGVSSLGRNPKPRGRKPTRTKR